MMYSLIPLFSAIHIHVANTSNMYTHAYTHARAHTSIYTQPHNYNVLIKFNASVV